MQIEIDADCRLKATDRNEVNKAERTHGALDLPLDLRKVRVTCGMHAISTVASTGPSTRSALRRILIRAPETKSCEALEASDGYGQVCERVHGQPII